MILVLREDINNKNVIVLKSDINMLAMIPDILDGITIIPKYLSTANIGTKSTIIEYS